MSESLPNREVEGYLKREKVFLPSRTNAEKSWKLAVATVKSVLRMVNA